MRLSRETVHTILQKDLKFHPYKMCVVQELRATDYEQREDFAIRMQVLLEENENAFIIMSDEAHFHLSGEVSKQNLHSWASENPLHIHKKLLHSEHVTVWCAIGIFGIIGPYFFEDENGANLTVNAEHYIHMLNTFLRAQMKDNVYTTCKMFIFNRIVPPHTLHDCQWTWFVACFQEGSFHVWQYPVDPKVP